MNGSAATEYPVRPTAISVVVENIPDDLKRLNHWVVWKYHFDTKRGEWTKPPYLVHGSGLASTTDPGGWSSFDAAVQRYRAGGLDGIGFVLTPDCGIVGIDLDHCFDRKTSVCEQSAIDIIQSIRSYTEFSPSGSGIRIFAKGTLPEGGRKKGNIEVYSKERYLTLTGHRLKNAPAIIEDRQQAITDFHEKYFPDEQKTKTSLNQSQKENRLGASDDVELLAKAFGARNGDKLKRLFAGDVTGYSSQSEADLALCSHLAFWFRDPDRIDRVFRGSALMREKWDEKHGAQSYGEGTIARALEGRTDFYQGEKLIDWPKPQALPDELPPVPAMMPAMIPQSLRPWLCDIADRMQCALEFPVIGAIVTAGSLIGRQLAIRPKRKDDWTVYANLWGAVVGRPGIMKTPALDEAKKPLQRLEIAAPEDHEKQKQEHEIKLMVLKAKKEELQRKIKEAVASGTSTEGFGFEIPKEEELVLRRYMVNDSTVEKLGELLNQNPNGLLLFRDELTGWLRTLDREGHENDRAFYLESWNGNGSYTYDRIGRGTLHIEAACVSILGGIQPGPLNDYLVSTLKGGAGADGLFQRFQLLVYPDDPVTWTNVDRWPNMTAKNEAFKVFEDIAGDSFVGFVSSAGVGVDENNNVRFLRFSPEAQEVFDDWRGELEKTIRAGDEHPAVEAHLSKYRSLMPSLALIFHVVSTVADGTASPVSVDAAEMATAWCDYLEAHARRVYHGLTQQDVSTAHRLGSKIAAGKLADPFTAREVILKGWTGLSDTDAIVAGLAVLEYLGWVKPEKVAPTTTGGRPTVKYWVSPKVKKAVSERCAS